MFPRKRIRLPQTAIALSASALLLAGTTAFAQVAYDAQIPFSISSYTLADPTGVAVAPDGTVYVADIQSSSTANLIRIAPATGAVGGNSGGAAYIAATGAQLTPSGVTSARPTAVAVDSTGILYVADATSRVVYKISSPESSTSPAATAISYGTGTETPTALAVDLSNNLYIADETQGVIYEVTGGVATQLAIGSGLKPVGLAPDSAGDVYFADAESNDIYEYSATTKSASVFLSTTSAGNFNFSATYSVQPVGMGVDPAGDVYILDSGNDRLIEATSSTNTFEVPFTSINHPGSAVLSSTGNIYLSDDSNDAVDEIYYNHNPVNFGSINAGKNSPQVTLNYNFIGAEPEVAWYQSVQGDKTGEFANPTTYPCGTSNFFTTVQAGTQCSFVMEVNYLGATPGIRSGAYGLTDGNNDLLAVPTSGIDVAGSFVLYPGTQNVLSQSSQTLYEPQGVAVSGDGGTLFVADEGGVLNTNPATYPHPAVWAYPVSGTKPVGTPSSSSPTLVGGGFATPMALALDGTGNLYVADYSGYVRKVPPASNWATSGTNLSLPTGMLNHPMALAFDPSGNLYIGDMGPAGPLATASNPGYIVKVPADGGPAVKLNYTVGGTPVIFPEGLTTDSFGNLYIADGGDGQTTFGGIDVVTASTGAISAISFGAYGALNQPSAVSFDAAGDLYVLDGYNQRVLVIPIDYTGSTPSPNSDYVTTLGYGDSGISNLLVTPSSLVVWPGGQNITIADLGYNPSSGPSSPTQIITLQAYDASVVVSPGVGSLDGVNVGNQEITFSSPAVTGSAKGYTFTVPYCGSSGSSVETGIVNPCTVTVDYAGTGTHTAYITLNGNTGDDYSALGNVITATATPNEPQASVSASGISNNAVTVTIENLGALNLVISNIQLTGADNSILNGGTCTIGDSLGLDASCTVIVSFDNGLFSSGTVVFTDNSGGVLGSTQSQYVFDFLGFGGGLFDTVGGSGPINTGLGGTTFNAPSSDQTKVGIVHGANDTQAGTGSTAFRPGDGAAAQPENTVQPQPGSEVQPASTIQTGSQPQPVSGYVPIGVIQPSFVAPDDNSISAGDTTSTDDTANSDQGEKTSGKKNTTKSDDGSTGAANSGDSTQPQP